jgi:hypothetical protein
VKDISMHMATGHAYRESGEFVLATDKRGLRSKSAPRDGERLPITELGSKAVFEVYAERFVAVTPVG